MRFKIELFAVTFMIVFIVEGILQCLMNYGEVSIVGCLSLAFAFSCVVQIIAMFGGKP